MNALRSDTRQKLLASAAAAAASSRPRNTGDVPQLAPELRSRLLDQHNARCLAARS